MAVPMLWMGEEMGDNYWNETISKTAGLATAYRKSGVVWYIGG
jgi:hypothetical protein